MFINPMILPFMIYQRWLELVFMPFLNDVEQSTKQAVKNAETATTEIIDQTKQTVKSPLA